MYEPDLVWIRRRDLMFPGFTNTTFTIPVGERRAINDGHQTAWTTATQIEEPRSPWVTRMSANFHGPLMPGVPNSASVFGSYRQSTFPLEEKQKSCSEVERRSRALVATTSISGTPSPSKSTIWVDRKSVVEGKSVDLGG